MTRYLIVLTAILFTAPALAKSVDRSEIKSQKGEVQEARKYSKSTQRLVNRWSRAADRNNERKMARLDAELTAMYQTELARLRDLGVPTIEPMVHPQHPELARSPRKNMDPLRDDLVTLKQLQRDINDGSSRRSILNVKARLLERVAENIQARHERKDKQLAILKS